MIPINIHYRLKEKFSLAVCHLEIKDIVSINTTKNKCWGRFWLGVKLFFTGKGILSFKRLEVVIEKDPKNKELFAKFPWLKTLCKTHAVALDGIKPVVGGPRFDDDFKEEEEEVEADKKIANDDHLLVPPIIKNKHKDDGFNDIDFDDINLEEDGEDDDLETARVASLNDHKKVPKEGTDKDFEEALKASKLEEEKKKAERDRKEAEQLKKVKELIENEKNKKVEQPQPPKVAKVEPVLKPANKDDEAIEDEALLEAMRQSKGNQAPEGAPIKLPEEQKNVLELKHDDLDACKAAAKDLIAKSMKENNLEKYEKGINESIVDFCLVRGLGSKDKKIDDAETQLFKQELVKRKEALTDNEEERKAINFFATKLLIYAAQYKKG